MQLNKKEREEVLKRIEDYNIGEPSELKPLPNPNKLYPYAKGKGFGSFFKRKNDKKMLLINIELNSGFVDSFIVEQDAASFVYENKKYVLDLNMKYWHIASKYYALDYHEGFALPIKRHFDIENLQKTIEKSGEYDCELATNPSNLQTFMHSNIIEQVISGAMLSKWLNVMKIMIIVNLVLSGLNAVFALITIFLRGTGK